MRDAEGVAPKEKIVSRSRLGATAVGSGSAGGEQAGSEASGVVVGDSRRTFCAVNKCLWTVVAVHGLEVDADGSQDRALAL